MHHFLILLSALLAINDASAHVALWNPGLYGFNGTNNSVAQYNTALAVQPLRKTDNRTQAEWFGHGNLNLPPKAGDFMELAAGGSSTFELNCNRAYTSFRDPKATGALPKWACNAQGPLHTLNEINSTAAPNKTLLGGCALAIAYESDVTKLKPADFAVFSVNHTCAWTREIQFDVPKDMPACPEGGCHCSWNWIHTAGNWNANRQSEGYGSEMYHNIYRCMVNNSTNMTAVVAAPKVANECLNKPSNCTAGSKQPHYWMQLDGNNTLSAVPPLYNLMYGWADGAQNDIFTVNTTTSKHDSAARPRLVGSTRSWAWIGAGLASVFLLVPI